MAIPEDEIALVVRIKGLPERNLLAINNKDHLFQDLQVIFATSHLNLMLVCAKDANLREVDVYLGRGPQGFQEPVSPDLELSVLNALQEFMQAYSIPSDYQIKTRWGGGPSIHAPR